MKYEEKGKQRGEMQTFIEGFRQTLWHVFYRIDVSEIVYTCGLTFSLKEDEDFF